MKQKRMLITFIPLALLIVLAAFSAGVVLTAPADEAPAAAIGTGFTFQGELADSMALVNDDCDFEFSLWDAASGPNQVGATHTVTNVPVAEGRFTALVNDANQFGNSAFVSEDRWLEIAVRCPAGGGSYTTLTPRQPLTAAPFAQFSARAGAVPWGGLINVPPGFADGIDDDTTYTAGAGLNLAGTQFNAQGTPYANVVIVAQSGGDYSSIQTALDNITGTAGNPYLVWVAPGEYNETIDMEPYVDIVGAGQELTKITSAGSGDNATGTVIGADNAELRDLTIENTGGANYAKGIYNNNVSPRLTRVTIMISGATNTNLGVDNVLGASPELTYVTIIGSGTAATKGMFNGGGAPVVSHSTISVSGCTTGVCYATDSRDNAQPIFNHVTVYAEATGSVSVVAFFANADSVLTLNYVTGTAVNGANSSGLSLVSATATVRYSRLTGENSGGAAYGLNLSGATGPYTIPVLHSELSGATNTIKGAGAYTVDVAGTLLDGGAVNAGGGTITCAGVYDESYAFYTNTCP